ncbi:hypothetical protein GCG54_00003589 [Colletotrichum gloeosporioides]|uniref:Uncharacterized protein n=1 Tax=Colletotrichum gloeosporioides TaxID=474922 RepID=A0A8H4FG22_COLGL|nr:uncharacterized protein GCG54_00003589 [Colletotrichum gloeosporioides]KAF3800690.1 hypothetical protein GCG54_00003589 [Colletotrichum gloeosporioides]
MFVQTMGVPLQAPAIRRLFSTPRKSSKFREFQTTLARTTHRFSRPHRTKAHLARPGTATGTTWRDSRRGCDWA